MIDSANQHRIYEGLVTFLYQHELEAGDTFLDVGANIGHHTWQMAEAVGSDGSGFAIEAVPALAERVQTVLKHKSLTGVEIVQRAVADAPGRAEFYFRPSHIGWSSLYADHVHPADEDDDLERFEVEIDTLDTLLIDRCDSLKFIKLDIEHSEFRALRGASALLRKHQPMLVFENSPLVSAEVSGYSHEEFFEFFEDHDYQLFDIYLNPYNLETLRATMPADLSTYYVGLPTHHPAAADPKGHFDIDSEYNRLLSQ